MCRVHLHNGERSEGGRKEGKKGKGPRNADMQMVIFFREKERAASVSLTDPLMILKTF